MLVVGGPELRGANLSSSRAAVKVANTYREVLANVGLHPWSVLQPLDEALYHQLAELAHNNSRVVGVGEIGLDFSRETPPEVQVEAFRRQLRVAKELKLPVNLHIRKATPEAIQILKEEGPLDRGGVMHGFTGNQEDAQECLDMGFCIGVGRIMLAPVTPEAEALVRNVPLSRLLLETDSAGLPPQEGSPRFTPAATRMVAEKVAQIKGTSLDEVARVTSENARQLFGLDRFGI